MMMISRGFSYGGFSYSYILRSYFGCMPSSSSSSSASASDTPDNCHNLGWCSFFKPAHLFPQRTRYGLLLGKFIQRLKTQICTFFVMEILDAPSQVINVRNTTSQCHRHQVSHDRNSCDVCVKIWKFG